MTNRIAITLGLMIAAALAADAYFQGWEGSIFLARKLSELIEYLAFWR